MKPELKQKWVEALRSGKYEQGECALRTSDDKFCCLGVLCDVVAPNGWMDGVDEDAFGHTESKHTAYLPPGISGLTQVGDDDAQTLTQMNDSGKAFPEIADYIEANL